MQQYHEKSQWHAGEAFCTGLYSRKLHGGQLVQKVMNKGPSIKADEGTASGCTGWAVVQVSKETHREFVLTKERARR